MTTKQKTWLENPQQGAACAVIAEIAQAHDGSLGMAHAYIDAVAESGAHAIKFQTHFADQESTHAEPWRVQFSQQDKTRYDYWKRMEFEPEEWVGLKDHAVEKGLLFLSSPFSVKAVDLLDSLNMPVWKIASGEITNKPMLDAIINTGKPIMLSTGLSGWDEIMPTAELLKAKGNPLAVMQCTTQYPSPPETIGLNVLPQIREKMDCAVGLSDHSATIYPGLAAATMGCEVIEVHVTMSRDMFGPDVVASLTINELKTLVEGVAFIEEMKANPVDKSTPHKDAAPLRDIFLKSVVPLKDLPAGTCLSDEHLGTKKPGTGIPASDYGSVIGRVLARPVKADIPLQLEDLD